MIVGLPKGSEEEYNIILPKKTLYIHTAPANPFLLVFRVLALLYRSASIYRDKKSNIATPEGVQADIIAAGGRKLVK